MNQTCSTTQKGSWDLASTATKPGTGSLRTIKTLRRKLISDVSLFSKFAFNSFAIPFADFFAMLTAQPLNHGPGVGDGASHG